MLNYYYYIRHARLQMSERGITKDEVEETVETGSLLETKSNRRIREKLFTAGYR